MKRVAVLMVCTGNICRSPTAEFVLRRKVELTNDVNHKEELLVQMADVHREQLREPQEAIACYLSASEGWPEAVQRLGGTFAAEATRLRDRNSD